MACGRPTVDGKGEIGLPLGIHYLRNQCGRLDACFEIVCHLYFASLPLAVFFLDDDIASKLLTRIDFDFTYYKSMKRAKFSPHSLVLTDVSYVCFAVVPALLCSVGVYGLLITQIEEPGVLEHLIMAAIGLAPSMLLYFVLLKMETGRKRKEHERRERKLRLKKYASQTPFNNGDGLLSAYDGEKHYEPLSPQEIQLMKQELKKQVADRMEKGTLKKNKGMALDLSVSDFAEEEGQAIGEGVKAYFRAKDKPQSVLQKKRFSEGDQPREPVSPLEAAIKKRIQHAKTPEEASPFRPINEDSVQDTLRYLEEFRRQKIEPKR